MAINFQLKSIAQELSASLAIAQSMIGDDEDWKKVRELRDMSKQKREELGIVQKKDESMNEKRIRLFLENCVAVSVKNPQLESSPPSTKVATNIPSSVGCRASPASSVIDSEKNGDISGK